MTIRSEQTSFRHDSSVSRTRPRRALRTRRKDQHGEGVISAAIAVLVMAFLGVAMWISFSLIFQHAANNVNHQVNNCIGQASSNC